jgi:hypothetical protein
MKISWKFHHLVDQQFLYIFFDFFHLHHNFMGEKTKTDIYLCEIKRLHKVLPPAAQRLLCPTEQLAFSTKFSYLKNHHGYIWLGYLRDISLRDIHFFKRYLMPDS